MELTKEMVIEQGGEVTSYNEMIDTLGAAELRFDQKYYEHLMNGVVDVILKSIEQPRKFKQCSTIFAAVFNIMVESYASIKWEEEPNIPSIELVVRVEDFDDCAIRTSLVLKQVLGYLNKEAKILGKQEKSDANVVKVMTLQHMAFNIMISVSQAIGSIELVAQATEGLSHINIVDE